MRHITVKGDNFACGLQLGQRLKKEIRKNIRIKTIDPLPHQDILQKINEECIKRYPRYVEELKGMAQGSGVDYFALLLLNSPEVREHGCSSIAINDESRTVLAHNEDEEKSYDRSMCALVTFVQKDRVLNSFCYAGELLGTAYGWNSYGLYVTGNRLVPPARTPRAPLYFVTRAVLDAGSIDEAVRTLKAGSGVGWHSFLAQGTRIVSVEQLYEKTSVVEVKGEMYHTNHYMHKAFSRKPFSYESSTRRLQQMKKLAGRSPREILFDDAHAPYAIYQGADDVNCTLSTVIFDVRNRKVTIYEGKRAVL